VDTDDLDSPYREFGRMAAGPGIRHVVSTGMPSAQRSIGELNIYQTADDAFTSAFPRRRRFNMLLTGRPRAPLGLVVSVTATSPACAHGSG
jgi:hypothetical protein